MAIRLTKLTNPRQVCIQVPASTSNLGSGFDTLGLAVRLYNRVRVRPSGNKQMVPTWQMSEEDRSWFAVALSDAANVFFRTTGVRRFGAEVNLQGDVPVARGLGASATVRVGVLAALNELSGAGLDRETLLSMAAELEGHPDNASPAIFGGFTVSGKVAGVVRCSSFRVASRLKLVTLMPSFGISTEAARRLMPPTYSKADAAHALNRAALITAAVASRNYENLRGVFDDRLHQPYREKLLPQLSEVIRAGERAGALGGFLSGSGSSIICLALTRADFVRRAMQKVMHDAEVKILEADNWGMKVLKDATYD
jgi:homoserine kinase